MYKCRVCNSDTTDRCSRCGITYYCSRTCQVSDNDNHKGNCLRYSKIKNSECAERDILKFKLSFNLDNISELDDINRIHKFMGILNSTYRKSPHIMNFKQELNEKMKEIGPRIAKKQADDVDVPNVDIQSLLKCVKCFNYITSLCDIKYLFIVVIVILILYIIMK